METDTQTPKTPDTDTILKLLLQYFTDINREVDTLYPSYETTLLIKGFDFEDVSITVKKKYTDTDGKETKKGERGKREKEEEA